VLARIGAERPALVLLDMVRRYTPDYGFTVYGPQWLAALARTVAEVRATGAAVLVLGPVPDPHGYVPGCLSEHLDAVAACDPDRATAMNAAGIAAEQRAVKGAGGGYADLTPLFCTATACPVVVGDMLVFRDDNHLTVEYVRWLTPVLSALLTRALTPR
jgi:SGNH domain-containing protein